MLEDKFVGGWLWRYQPEPFESGSAIGISFLGLDYRTPGLVFLLNLGRTDGKVREDNSGQPLSIKHTSFQRDQTAETVTYYDWPRRKASIGADGHDFPGVCFA